MSRPLLCPHGVLFPHECRECEKAITDNAVKMFQRQMELEAQVRTLADMLVEVIRQPPGEMRKAGIRAYLQGVGLRQADDIVVVVQR